MSASQPLGDVVSPEHPDDQHSGDPIEPTGEGVPGGSDPDDLEQASLDELIALLGDGAPAPGTPDSSMEPMPEGFDHLFDQPELDAWVRGRSTEVPLTAEELLASERPEIEREPITDRTLLKVLMGPYYIPDEKNDSADADSPGLLKQSDIDAALSASDTEKTEPQLAATGAGSPGAEAQGAEPASGGLFSQEELDAFLNDQVKTYAINTQDFLDGEHPEIEREEIEDTTLLKALLGPDYSAFVGEESSTEDGATPEVYEPNAIASVNPEAVSQGDLDALIEELTDPGGIQESTEAEKAVVPDEPDAGIEIAPVRYDVRSEEEMSSEDKAAPEIVGEDEAGVATGEESSDVVADASAANSDYVLEGDEADEVLDGHDMDEQLGEVAEADASIVATAEHDSDSELVPEAETPVSTREAVGSENVAAGAAQDKGALSQDLLDQLVADAASGEAAPEKKEKPESVTEPETVSSSESTSEDETVAAPEPTLADMASSLAESPDADAEFDETDSDDAPEEQAAARVLLDEFTAGVLQNIAKNKKRAAAAIAATGLVTMSTFFYLYQNRLRPVDDLLAHTTVEVGDLQRTMRRAQELIRIGAPTDAIKLLEPIVEFAPPGSDRTDAEFLLLQAAYESLPAKLNTKQANRMHSAIDALADFAPTHPRVPEALYWKGQVYEREDNPLAARSVYRDASENYVGTEAMDRILLAYAELELQAGNPVQAARHLERLMEDYPGSPLALRARLLRGDAFAAAGDADTARIIYVRAAEDQPGTRIESQAYERLGRLAYTQGEYRNAIRDLETRLEAATTIEGNDTVYLLLAQSYRAIARHQDARDVLNELLRFFPESKVTPLAFVELSRVLSDSGLRKEALRVATETVQRYPSNPAVLRNEGERLAEYGDIRAAARAMLAAHAAGANDPELLLSAGKLFREGGMLDEAHDAFESIETHFSSAPQALEGRIEFAKVLYEQGQITRAFDRLEDLRMTTQAQPAHLLVLAALGELYQETGLLNRAGDIFGQIAATTSEPEMLAKAAIALLEAGEEEEGFNVIKRVNPSRLSDKTAYIFLNEYGDVLLRSDPRAGLEKLEQAYRDYPLQRTATANRKLLEANLVTGRAARARAIVIELQGRVATEQADPIHLETAALLWGDYLYEERDYRAAADAYAMALVPSPPTFGVQTEEEPISSLSTERQWSMYQRANALFELGDYPQSVALYDRLADSSSRWAKEAALRAISARIEQRLRGETLPETRESG